MVNNVNRNTDFLERFFPQTYCDAKTVLCMILIASDFKSFSPLFVSFQNFFFWLSLAISSCNCLVFLYFWKHLVRSGFLFFQCLGTAPRLWQDLVLHMLLKYVNDVIQALWISYY